MFRFSKIRLRNKKGEMFNFISLINISVTIGVSFLLLRKSPIVSSNTINILRSLFGFYPYFRKYYPFESSDKSFQIFNCFEPAPLSFLVNNQYFASYGSSAYK